MSGKFGYSGDFGQAIRQAIFVTDASFRDLYINAGGDRADHPVTLYRYLKIAADLSSRYGISMSVTVKGLYATAELLTALLIVAAAILLFGEAAALPAAGLYFLVPVFSYVGSAWGHHGCIEVFFTVASLLALGQRKYTLSLVGLGAALAFRVHSIVIAPFILLSFVVERISLKTRIVAIAAGVATHCALTFPILWEAGIEAYRLQYTGHLSNYSGLSYGAYNIWTFNAMREIVELFNLKALCLLAPGYPSSLDDATLFGFCLFSVAYLAALVLYLRLRRGNFIAAVLVPATLIYLCFYFLPTRIHERYIYHFLVLCTPLAAHMLRFFIPYSILVVTTLSSFTFFPSYLQWLQIRMNAGREPSILNELSMLGFFLLLPAFFLYPRRLATPPAQFSDMSRTVVRVATSVHLLAILTIVGLYFTYEYSGTWRGKSNFLESKLADARAYDRAADGSISPGIFNPAIKGFEFPNRHSWWSIKPGSFQNSSGVVQRGILMHPQPDVTRVLEMALNGGETAIQLHGYFDDNIRNNQHPAISHIAIVLDNKVIADTTLTAQKRSFSLEEALPNPQSKRLLRVEVKATDYREISQLNDLHLYLTAKVQ